MKRSKKLGINVWAVMFLTAIVSMGWVCQPPPEKTSTEKSPPKPSPYTGVSMEIDPNRPGWVDRGGGFFTGDRGKAFYGVGAANAMLGDVRRVAAETSGRADLVRSFGSRITDLVKIYSRGMVKDGKSDTEDFAQVVTKAFSSMTLSMAFAEDHYLDKSEKMFYALVRMDYGIFKQELEQLQNLSKEYKDIILKNAEVAFDELDAQGEKHKPQSEDAE